MARLGMAALILALRSMTAAQADEATVNDITYWTDDQLETILDKYRQDLLRQSLTSIPLQVDGVMDYSRYTFPIPFGYMIERPDTDEEEPTFRLYNSLGTLIPAADYAVDPVQGVITFIEAQTTPRVMYLRYRLFNMNLAAAQVWREKAAHRAHFITWRTGAHTLHDDQEYQHCLEMVRVFGGNRLTAVKLRRRGYVSS